MSGWDPAQYARFAAERERPALDLMARLPDDLEPAESWDLGCGPGAQAAALKRRWPQARVRGLDADAAMLAEARARPEAVEWIAGDIAAWAPDRPADLIFSNAALHWLDDHAGLFRRLADALAPGGVLAVQMPLSHDAVWHAVLRETAAAGPWAGALAGVRGVRAPATAEAYYDWLSPVCEPVEIWTTSYQHVLRGPDPVVEWMKGSGLRPYLSALPDGQRAAFLDAYRARVAEALPPRPTGETLLPFPRLFLLARRRP